MVHKMIIYKGSCKRFLLEAKHRVKLLINLVLGPKMDRKSYKFKVRLPICLLINKI